MFDPSELTVKQARARLCELDIAGLQELLQAEIDGKHRTSLIADIGRNIDMIKTAEAAEAQEVEEESVDAVEEEVVEASSELPLSAYHKDSRSKDGRRSRCAVCVSQRSKSASLRDPVDDGLTEKECTRCNKVLPIESFGIARRRLNGRNSWCRECCSAATREWQRTPQGRLKHIEAVKRYNEKRRREKLSHR